MGDSKGVHDLEQLNHLVLVTQQRRAGGSFEFSADDRPVPPHVLWQWIP